jgi:hypothetical protein
MRRATDRRRGGETEQAEADRLPRIGAPQPLQMQLHLRRALPEALERPGKSQHFSHSK